MQLQDWNVERPCVDGGKCVILAGGLKRFGRSFGGLNDKSFGDDATVSPAIGQRASELQA